MGEGSLTQEDIDHILGQDSISEFNINFSNTKKVIKEIIGIDFVHEELEKLFKAVLKDLPNDYAILDRYSLKDVHVTSNTKVAWECAENLSVKNKQPFGIYKCIGIVKADIKISKTGVVDV